MKVKVYTRYFYLFTLLIVLVLLFSFLDLYFGSVKIPLRDVFSILLSAESEKASWVNILYEFRLPKLFTALLTGSALAVAGLQMQTIFRNPLAGPYVLGISAGASLGVAILVMGFSSVIVFTGISFMGNWAIVSAAWIGSALVLFLIFIISLRVRDIMTILILGILLGSAIAAFVSILQYFSDESMLKTFIVWTMGSLGGVTKSQLLVLTPGIIIGLIISLLSGKILNVLLLGESYAASMGLNVKLARFVIFISTSMLAGSVTAFCGPIGFVGIAVPHIARMVFRTANHNILLWGTLLLGALLMLIGDIISQLPGSQNTLPINAVTALLGIPIVIWLIIKNQKLSSLM